MVCSEHVKEQIFVRRRQRLHEWWFDFLLCVDRVSDAIQTGALLTGHTMLQITFDPYSASIRASPSPLQLQSTVMGSFILGVC